MSTIKFTATERKFAQRMTRRAAALALASGNVLRHQEFLWRLLVEASHKRPKSVKAV